MVAIEPLAEEVAIIRNSSQVKPAKNTSISGVVELRHIGNSDDIIVAVKIPPAGCPQGAANRGQIPMAVPGLERAAIQLVERQIKRQIRVTDKIHCSPHEAA